MNIYQQVSDDLADAINAIEASDQVALVAALRRMHYTLDSSAFANGETYQPRSRAKG